MNEFCRLGDLLSVDEDADAAVIARDSQRWFRFRSLASFLTDKDVSLLLRGNVYDACVQSCMLHGSETWSMKKIKTNWYCTGQK